MGRHNFQPGTQGVFVPKFKVAEDFEIGFTNLEESFLGQVLHQSGFGPSDVADYASSHGKHDHGLVEAAPEFNPQFCSQSFISRGEKKPH